MNLFKLNQITKRCGFIFFIMSLFFLSRCGAGNENTTISSQNTGSPQNTGGGGTSSFTLTSGTYSDGGVIPRANACELASFSKGVSPQYGWANPPAGTVTFALIMDNTSCPNKACGHWGVFNIPSGVSFVAEDQDIGLIPGVEESYHYGGGTIKDYSGPCPYRLVKNTFITTIYALNANSTVLNIQTNKEWNRSDFLSTYSQNILGTASITGTYTGR